MEQAILEQAGGGNTKPPQRKVRGFMITHWSKDDWLTKEKNVVYTVIGEEICPNTGKVHYHQWIYFKNPRRAVKTRNGSHVEQQGGSNKEAYTYATKDGKIVFEEGVKPNDNGQTNSLQEALKEPSLEKVIENHPMVYCRYKNGIKDIFDHRNSKERYYKQPEVYWLVGGTGTGKTRKAFEDGAYPVEYNNGFFTDWKDSRIISIEEFRGEIPFRILLKITDGYHNYYSINIKGGQKLVDLDKIYITSPLKPTDIYTHQSKDAIDQLERRITEIIDFGGVDKTTTSFDLHWDEGG